MAIANNAVWEVRTAGLGASDANGGFYVSGGVDYSQQDAAQLAVSDAVTNGTTTVTSAAGGFTSAMVGNGINIAGIPYQITAVASLNSMSVTPSPPTGTGQAGKVGGACASPGYVTGFAQNQNTIWIKAGTYLIGSGTTNTAGNSITVVNGKGFRFNGYNAARGDDGTPPVLRCNAANIIIMVFPGSGQFNLVRNIAYDGASQTYTSAFGYLNAGYIRIEKCVFTNLIGGGSAGFSNAVASGSSNDIEFIQCCVSGCAGSPFNAQARFVQCYVTGCAIGFETFVGGSLFYCIAYNNTGVGIQSDRGGRPLVATNCAAVGNGGAGFNFGSSEQAANSLSYLQNCIAYGNGGYGFSGFHSGFEELISCAGGRNTSGNYTSGLSVTGFQALTNTDANGPFMSVATGDFRLNPAYVDYAKLKAMAAPASWPGLAATLGYADIGPVQHKDAGGVLAVNLNGGIRG